MTIFARPTHTGILAVLILIAHIGALSRDAAAAAGGASPVHINDNRHPAGTVADGVLSVSLRAGLGLWRPEGQSGPELTIEAFGEDTGTLQVPAPLVRV